jgi:hypothetical protein
LLAQAWLANRFNSCDSGIYDFFKSEVSVAKASTSSKGPRKSVRDGKSEFGKDRRRKHHHFLVTVNYADGETFGRVYTNKEKATRFAERQRRSPIVKSARVTQVS